MICDQGNLATFSYFLVEALLSRKRAGEMAYPLEEERSFYGNGCLFIKSLSKLRRLRERAIVI